MEQRGDVEQVLGVFQGGHLSVAILCLGGHFLFKIIQGRSIPYVIADSGGSLEMIAVFCLCLWEGEGRWVNKGYHLRNAMHFMCILFSSNAHFQYFDEVLP